MTNVKSEMTNGVLVPREITYFTFNFDFGYNAALAGPRSVE